MHVYAFAMQQHAVAVVGASGYSGLELTRILSRHPHVRLTALLSDRWAGERAGAHLPLEGPAAALIYGPLSGAEEVPAELAFLATPAEVSAELAPKLLARGVQVVDLSGAFRLRDPAAYPVWYGFEHPAPELLAEACYGLPELSREGLHGARLVANAGCYASAVALALAPLVKSGLVSSEGIAVTALSGASGAGRKASEEYSFVELQDDLRAYRLGKHQHVPEVEQAVAPFLKAGVALPEGVAVTGMSGVSGAGRKASEDYSFVEVADDLRAYRIGKHQHVPEIEQTVARYAGACGPISFTPVLTPIRRGILATVTVRLEKAPPPGLADALRAAYLDEPFVRALAPEKVMVKDVLHTNRCHVGLSVDARAGVVVAVSAIDNLVKGAAGQAIQATNAAYGWAETTGLDLLGG